MNRCDTSTYRYARIVLRMQVVGISILSAYCEKPSLVHDF